MIEYNTTCFVSLLFFPSYFFILATQSTECGIGERYCFQEGCMPLTSACNNTGEYHTYIITHSAIAKSGNIGMGPIHQSIHVYVHLSVLT